MIEQMLTTFTFRTIWTPELLVIILAIAGLYLTVVGKWRSRFQDAEPVLVRQKLYFFTGLLALYVGWGGPLYTVGHMILTFHMTQMIFAYFIAVPLLILGLPIWFLRAVIRRFSSLVSSKGFQIITSPLVALLWFNMLFSIYHIPVVFDSLMQAVVLHSVYEIILFLAAGLMWWHMIAPLPSKASLSELRRIGYVFANGLLLTPACALIIFAGQPLYATYTDVSTWAAVMAYCLPASADIPYHLFNDGGRSWALPPLEDQQLAGVIMKVVQEIAYGFAVGYIFKQWVKKEKEHEPEDYGVNEVELYAEDGLKR